VRLGPDQFPELYYRVQDLATRAGIKELPEVYIMQAGGTLNALATKFLRSRMIVLFSDLLDACGENESARDMIIGHELGHIKAGHLRWLWLIFPGMLVPFLGSAYSRAREYTCDRYGALLCGDRHGALIGLTILAAGGVKGPRVNLTAFVNQRRDLNTGLMTLGKWFGTHPPLCDRIAALEPALVAGSESLTKGPLRAVAIIGLCAVLPVILMLGTFFLIGSSSFFAEIQKAIKEADKAQQMQQSRSISPPTSNTSNIEAVKNRIENDLAEEARLVEEIHKKTGRFPSGTDGSLSSEWKLYRTGEPEPLDPFSESSYLYFTDEGVYIIWSVGPDKESGTDDYIEYRSDQK
jgi:hypothetical protein